MWVTCGLWDGAALLLSAAHVDWVTNAALGVPTATDDASLAVAVQMDRVIPSFPPQWAHYSSFQGMPSRCQPGACVCVREGERQLL